MFGLNQEYNFVFEICRAPFLNRDEAVDKEEVPNWAKLGVICAIARSVFADEFERQGRQTRQKGRQI